MHTDNGYYTLRSKKKNIGKSILSVLGIPFKVPSWIFSTLVARFITHIVLNPSFVPEQRPIHLIKISEDSHDDLVIINFKKNPESKWFNDFLLIGTPIISFIPFIAPQLRTRLLYNQLSDRKYVDVLLSEIDKLIIGTSNKKNCIGRVFDWSHIHLKGLEFLDAKMRVYIYEQLDKKYGQQAYNQARNTHIEFFSIRSSDKSELDSVEVIAPGEQYKPMSERKFVITCLARDQNYIHWLKDLNYTATHLEATAISFNYRGIDLSRGIVWTEQDMIDDVLAQVQRLMNLGAKPENICLDGMCLGGAIATLAASQLHRQHCHVKLNNERSFRSLPRLIFGYIAPELQTANWWSPLTYLRFTAAVLSYTLFTPILWLGGWYTNAEKAWDEIPAKDKIYSIIRDKEHHIYDGIINDHFSSIASLIDEQLNKIKNNLRQGIALTPKEAALLMEHGKTEYTQFIASKKSFLSKKYHSLHFVARKELVAELGHQEPYTNHDYFLKKLKDKFTPGSSPKPKDSAIIETTDPLNLLPEKPLILACSGGAGHISAAKGIINQLKEKNPDVIISYHQAALYKKKSFTFTAFFIRLGIWVASLPIIGFLVNKISYALGIPSMPNYKVFWDQMSKIQQAETTLKEGAEQGQQRPYVDVLLDFFPAGYEFTAYNNAAHLSLTAKETMSISSYKGNVEEHNHSSVFKNTLHLLIQAAKKGSPYTQIISTQALSIKSLCDAVFYYNNTFLPKYNSKHGTAYPIVNIDQYMTDLPSLGCAHFMDNLESLSQEHRQLIKLYTVYMSEPVKAAYFRKNHGFRAVYHIDPKQNPMVRSGFKNEALRNDIDFNKPLQLTYKNYIQDPITGVSITSENKNIEVNAGEKVASIMIGSLAANASVDYIEHLLKAGYEHIFVFGGSNDEISKRIEKLIAKYPTDEQDQINKKIIRLGNQTDVEMAPIFTRSNCVVIRGGGLSVMEQMAMPLIKYKTILMHHEDNDNDHLTSGLSWEDANTGRLIDYMTEQKVFAVKTSPKLCKKALDSAQAFYAPKIAENVEPITEILMTSAHHHSSIASVKQLIPTNETMILAMDKSPRKQHGFFSRIKREQNTELDVCDTIVPNFGGC